MTNDLLSIIHNLLYCINNTEFTEQERAYIMEVIIKVINLISDLEVP